MSDRPPGYSAPRWCLGWAIVRVGAWVLKGKLGDPQPPIDDALATFAPDAEATGPRHTHGYKTNGEYFNSLLAQNQALRDALEEIRDLKPAPGETPTHQAASLWRSLAFVDMQAIARRDLSPQESG